MPMHYFVITLLCLTYVHSYIYTYIYVSHCLCPW